MTGLALGEELAVRDLPLEARLLLLHCGDLLLRGRDFRVVHPRDLVRRLVDTGRRRPAQLVVDRPAVDHLRHGQPDDERDRKREHEPWERDHQVPEPARAEALQHESLDQAIEHCPDRHAPRARFAIDVLHHWLAATVIANPLTTAIPATHMPSPPRKLVSLGTVART